MREVLVIVNLTNIWAPGIWAHRADFVLWITVMGAGLVKDSPAHMLHGFKIAHISMYDISIVLL